MPKTSYGPGVLVLGASALGALIVIIRWLTVPKGTTPTELVYVRTAHWHLYIVLIAGVVQAFFALRLFRGALVRPYPGRISRADPARAERRTSERRDANRDTQSVPVSRYVGIDLATEAKRTGVVIVTLSGATADASMPADGFVADDHGLVEVVDRATAVGLDSPLGWPDDFVSAVTAHRQSARWPTFEHRSTDRFVQICVIVRLISL